MDRMTLGVSTVGLALCVPALFGQAIAGQSASANGPAEAPSALMQPSLDVVKTALGEVRVEKWKGPGAARSEADSNVASIRKDVEVTLPGLLSAADAAPDSAAKVLPAYRNVEALYDVLLRVDAAGHLQAPADQSSALDQALARLEEGRRALGDRLQSDAAAAEKRVGDLQVALKATPPPVAAAAPVACPPVTPAKKKKVARPVAKPDQ